MPALIEEVARRPSLHAAFRHRAAFRLKTSRKKPVAKKTRTRLESSHAAQRHTLGVLQIANAMRG
jgi:hypothetical protein